MPRSPTGTASHSRDESGAAVDETCRILVVDDSPHNLVSIEAILADLGHELVLVDSGEAALRELLAREFAAVLLDIKMPGLDGFEVARMMRRHRRWEHTPIIFMTAFSEAEADMARAYPLGAVDFIFAPFMPEPLRAKVSVFAELHRKSNQIVRQSEQMRRAAERRADDLALRLDSLLNNLEVGVFQADLEGRVVSSNPAFDRLLGDRWGEEERSLQDLFEDPEPFYTLRRELLERGGIHGRAIGLGHADGRSDRLSWTLTIGGKPGQCLIEGVIEDVSEQKRAEEALVAKTEELARSNSQLENFAYVASHDMQEPLRKISLLASLVSCEYEGVLDEHGRQWLAQLGACSGHICTMIRDVLAFARAGRVGLKHEVVAFDRVVDRVRFSLGEAIRDSAAEIVADTPGTVRGNESLLEQLFQNLVSNAIRFRTGSGPQVRITTEERDGLWHCAVSDDGIGIPPDQRENVFRLFHRLGGPSRSEGSGIGLALCRRIVEHHGGEIWVEPAESGGTCIRFTLRDANEGGVLDGARSEADRRQRTTVG